MDVDKPEESSIEILAREVYITPESIALAQTVDSLDIYLTFTRKEET